MNPTPVIDMFSGTARKYLKHRFPDVEVRKDFRDQDVPEGSIVTIGAPCQDLSVAGKHAGAERGSETRSSLIHEALDMAVAGGADLIVAENVPRGHSTYLALANWLAKEHGYRTTVSSAGAWEVGAPHRRERVMLVAASRHFDAHRVNVIRQTWETVTGVYSPPTGQTCQFMHWMMGLCPRLPDALGLSVSAQRRLAGNAVVGLQARLMLQRGFTATNNTKGNL